MACSRISDPDHPTQTPARLRQLADVVDASICFLIKKLTGLGSLAFSPDGGRAASGDWDGVMILWRAE
uniref:Uncharacterized protein n=1 Tax=Candidatus Kentrum eta TaxID=2126337 RepID=A0A450UBG0_9GAMM|nr:MAG: hypothetical protein BECKH772A_GA0070896_100164 [Candidatus Kentron sp. H]VFJ92767.1 MAG: hypothetical protein BECKH772B_GA0070898_1003315 [Candidatus Kentron sp. H]VFJ97558.1 MAG: hypothetical protein BECKH772C_GA0070978_100143 [Candidatus Kentron sp. H]